MMKIVGLKVLMRGHLHKICMWSKMAVRSAQLTALHLCLSPDPEPWCVQRPFYLSRACGGQPEDCPRRPIQLYPRKPTQLYPRRPTQLYLRKPTQLYPRNPLSFIQGNPLSFLYPEFAR